ncbi:hypothetical protein CYMTET_34940, partial [Cymbomonas tetramitiformis]
VIEPFYDGEAVEVTCTTPEDLLNACHQLYDVLSSELTELMTLDSDIPAILAHGLKVTSVIKQILGGQVSSRPGASDTLILTAGRGTQFGHGNVRYSCPAGKRSGVEMRPVEPLWARFRQEFAARLQVLNTDSRHMLGHGVWNLARVLSNSDKDHTTKREQTMVALPDLGRWGWHACDQASRATWKWVAQWFLAQKPDSSVLKSTAFMKSLGPSGHWRKENSAYEREAKRMMVAMHTSNEADDALSCIIRMMQLPTIPDELVVAALQLLRCSIYAEEPGLTVENDAEAHRTANFQRFVIGQPPVKFATSPEIAVQQRRLVQLRHAAAGVGSVALRYLHASNPQVVAASRRLLIALTDGGNLQVLDLLHTELTRTDTANSKLLAENFFSTLSTVLQHIPTMVHNYHRLLVRGTETMIERKDRLSRNRSSIRFEQPEPNESGPQIRKNKNGKRMSVHKMSVRAAQPETLFEAFRRVNSVVPVAPPNVNQAASNHFAAEDSITDSAEEQLNVPVETITDLMHKIKDGCELLRMMQLLCTGHHAGNQSLMHTQPHCAMSHDLIAMIAGLTETLACLVPECLTGGFLHIPMLLLQCVQTLTEFVQGPCTENQLQLLLHSTLIKTLDSMMRSIHLEEFLTPLDRKRRPSFFRTIASHLDPDTVDLWALDTSSALMCTSLHISILTFLKSLLEGDERQSCLSMLPKVYIAGLYEKAVSLHNLLGFLNSSRDDHEYRERLAPLIDWHFYWPQLAATHRTMRSYAPVDALLPLGSHPSVSNQQQLLLDACYSHVSLLMVLGQLSGEGMNAFVHGDDASEVPDFSHMVMATEVVCRDKVVKVFFRVPRECLNVGANHVARFKKRLLQLPRKSPQGKAKAFMKLAHETAFNLMHLAALRQVPHKRQLVDHEQLIVQAPFYIAGVICVLLTVSNGTGVSHAVAFGLRGWLELLIHVLGILHFGSTVLCIWRYVEVEVPVVQFIGHNSSPRPTARTQRARSAQHGRASIVAIGDSQCDINVSSLELQRILQEDRAQHSAQRSSFLLHDVYLFMLTVQMVVSLTSLCVSPFLYVLFMMVYVIDNPMARNILLALKNVGAGISSTVLLGILVVVIFAFVSFIFYYDDMETAYDDAGCTFSLDGATQQCEAETVTLFQVVAVHIQSAFLGMGLDPLFDPQATSASSLWRVTPLALLSNLHDHARNLHTVFFSLIWQLVLLNIITGLITDAFMTIRMEEKEKVADSAQRCLICSCDRSSLDGIKNYSFDVHIEHDHNPWSYACFLVYLMTKEESDLNGVEREVYNLWQQGKSEFVPIMRCYELEDQQSRMPSEQSSAHELVKMVDDRFQQTFKTQEKRMQSVESKVTDLMRAMQDLDSKMMYIRQQVTPAEHQAKVVKGDDLSRSKSSSLGSR